MSLQPQVRYCRTSDGVNIAYTTYGDGPPLLVPPNIVNTHLQVELGLPGVRRFYELLSKRVQVIRYDARGTGMSQRDAIDFSDDAGIRDMLAVVDRLGLERFALYGHIMMSNAPTAFLFRYPDRVTSLIIWIGQTIGITPEKVRQLRAMSPLMESEWELYANVSSRLVMGWDFADAAPLAELIIAGSDPVSRERAYEALERSRLEVLNVADAVRRGERSDLKIPTLIAHLAGSAATANAARSIAGASPAAHVVAIPGVATTKDPFVYDNEVLVAAIADFVEATAAAPPAKTGGKVANVGAPELQLGAMRAILFTDIVGHTEMMSRLGDAKGRDVLREHERITRETLDAHGGAEVKAMGDGFLAWFSSAQKAVECAVALQRNLSPDPASSAPKGEGSSIEGVSIRVGLNAGEPIEEDGDLFGTSVITASRICAQAGGGEIVVSDVVRQLVAGKGFEEPVRLWEVRW